MALVSVEPAEAESSGGLEVVVTGYNLTSTAGLMCDFGGALQPATWFSNTQVRCLTPRHPPAKVALRLSRDSGASLSTGFLQFTFQAQPSVLSISPVHGPMHGGSIVTVTGQHFRANAESGSQSGSSLACRFGTVVVPVRTLVSSNELTCVAPAAPRHTLSNGHGASTVYLEVSNSFNFDGNMHSHGLGDPNDMSTSGSGSR